MNLSAVITDNIAEILVKVMEFTQTRQKVLAQNINDIHRAGFVPKDLPVDEFSRLLNNAIDEHIRKQRLILRDTEHIKFGTNGSFEVQPIVDETAKKIFAESRDRYLELQINKLMENSLNHRIATELLMQKQRTTSIFG
jgi:flagellar basal body rod protein FlgB